MNTKGEKQAKVLTKGERKKRGIIYLVVAAFCLVISASGVLPQPNTLDTQLAVIIVSLLEALMAVGLLIGLIGGVYYLITGFSKKE